MSASAIFVCWHQSQGTQIVSVGMPHDDSHLCPFPLLAHHEIGVKLCAHTANGRQPHVFFFRWCRRGPSSRAGPVGRCSSETRWVSFKSINKQWDQVTKRKRTVMRPAGYRLCITEYIEDTVHFKGRADTVHQPLPAENKWKTAFGTIFYSFSVCFSFFIVPTDFELNSCATRVSYLTSCNLKKSDMIVLLTEKCRIIGSLFCKFSLFC